jgi:hypothetical protein
VLAGDAVALDIDIAGGVAEQAAETFIGGQRVAAIFDEAQHVVEGGAVKRGIGGGGGDFRVHGVRMEGGGAGHAE